MRNIYDDINEFYNQEPEWMQILPKQDVENFLRQEAWSGTSEDELSKLWEDLTIYFVYLVNSENFVGDMNRENFIDCVAWLARNIAGFQADYKTVSSFLAHMEVFYAHLAKKKMVRNGRAVSEAKERILRGNRVNYMDEEGFILPQFRESNIYPTADLPVKIFMNIGENLALAHALLGNFLADEDLASDLTRSQWLYSGFMDPEKWDEEVKDNPDLSSAWIDFYLYDYHLLESDKRPIELYYEYCKQEKYGPLPKAALEILEVLTHTRPIIFSIETYLEDGLYTVKDFFSNESFPLMLPIEGFHQASEYKDVIFAGHVFYNNTMTTHTIQGMRISKDKQLQLKKLFLRARDWFTAQEGNSGAMEEFLTRHAACIEHFFRYNQGITSSTLKDLDALKKYNFRSTYKVNYLEEDNVTNYLDAKLPNVIFSLRDVVLAKRLWTAFKKLTDKKVRRPELWAGAVLWNLSGINYGNTFSADEKFIVSMFEELKSSDSHSIFNYGNEIYDTLKLGDCDPRYLNEEGLLDKFFTEVVYDKKET